MYNAYLKNHNKQMSEHHILLLTYRDTDYFDMYIGSSRIQATRSQ